MDLVFAAEHYAQAQAAAVAAAQYYASAAAMNAAGGAPAGVMVTAPTGFGLMAPPIMSAASLGLPPGALPPAPIIGAPPPIPSSGDSSRSRTDEDDRGKSRHDRRDRDRRRDDDDRSPSGQRRDRNRDRDRRSDRGKRERSRERDRSPRRESRRDHSSDSSDEDIKNIPPNNTIMVRGLAQHITENDIRQDIADCGLIARDIRLIRKKETGASRGFAFVEFSKIDDAKAWMDAKQGTLLFKDQYRAVMQYSLPRDGRPGDPPKVLHDWICANCGVQNFRRRDHCFKCSGPKTDGAAEGADEVSSHPTGTVLLRGLDALSTEDSVLNCLKGLTQLPIKSIRIGRDSLTNTSRGVCYVEMNSVVDAMFLHNQLLGEPPAIDEKLVSVSYFRMPPQSNLQSQNPSAAVANAAMAAAQWSHQGKTKNGVEETSESTKYSEDEIERLAEYSASLYAKTSEEKQSYLEYYRQYYRNGGKDNVNSDVNHSSTTKPTENKQKKEDKPTDDLGMVTVDGVEYKKYPVPDVSTYVHEESSGYYYDSQTGLYYDVNSQYYYNSSTNQYMYWSSEYETYLPAPDGQNEKKKEDKKDKVKTAKKIAKDMERWAKTLNQRKEASKVPLPSSSSITKETSNVQGQELSSLSFNNRTNAAASGSEDIAFSMLQKKPGMSSSSSSKFPEERSPSSTGLAGLANYGSDSEDETSANQTSRLNDDSKHTDWSKLACLLCKRQFPTKEKLQKHNQVSDLHKQNLDAWKKRKLDDGGGGASSSSIMTALQYRDRAKERRQKYGGEDETPKPSRLKEKYLRAMQEVESASVPEKNIDSSNIGNKMLQKMGWKEGLGLGKSNQGRTSIIEADRRSANAGLGSGGPVRSNPNDSYKTVLNEQCSSGIKISIK